MRLTERRPQIVHAFHQQTATTLQKIDREKVGATRHTDATIVRHTPASRRWRRIAIGMRRAWVSENPSTPLHRARRPLRHRRAQGPPYENNFQGGVGRAQARLTSWIDDSAYYVTSAPSNARHQCRRYSERYSANHCVPPTLKALFLPDHL